MAEFVLIVDDDERNMRLTRDVLERAGMVTATASTAADAIAVARARRPDVVLMDLRLPDLDGSAAAVILAAGADTAGIPVLALSALSADEAAPLLEDGTFAGYIEKPIDVTSLPGLVRRHCRPR